MVKIKKCLDSDCHQFILLEDGRTISQPKDTCDHVKRDIDEYRKLHAEIARESKETIYVSGQLIKNAKPGKNVDL